MAASRPAAASSTASVNSNMRHPRASGDPAAYGADSRFHGNDILRLLCKYGEQTISSGHPMTALEKQIPADYAAARFHMVEGQLRPNKVTDQRILDVMGTLPREFFVPSPMAGIAYQDEDIQVMSGRYLMEPMVLARLLQEASIGPEDRVLDIAPATGYSTAVIARLVKDVIGVESNASLQKQAIDNLASLKIENASIQQGNMTEGSKDQAPYNVILINGSVEVLPEKLFAQLAEGGRLVAVMRQYGPARAAHIGEARLYEKIHGAVSSRPLFDANIHPLMEFNAPAKFTFGGGQNV